ncbi:MAG: OmpA family protein [Gemmatimonadaceae bacterium]|nr:OmpA family protein [Gemmatimonadaceae bacterium]
MSCRWLPLRALGIVVAPLLVTACGVFGGRAPARPEPESTPDATLATEVRAPADAAVRETPAPTPTEPRPTPASAPAVAPAAPPVTVAAAENVGGTVVDRRRTLVGRGQQLAPDEVGYYMDTQEARFRQLAPQGIRVVRNGEQLMLTLPGSMSFDVASATLSAVADSALGVIARVVAEYRLTLVSVRGFTDSTGDAAVNRRLSEQRALSVARALLARGITAERIIATGFGAAQPLASNETPEGREQNRRIELVLAPLRP